MCDHLINPQICRRLLSSPHPADTVTLCVDFKIDNPLNDPEDVTRVKCCGDRIERIGKVIREFDAIDTGVFLCSPIMFDALEASQSEGDDSISGAMNVLARWGKARTFDIQDLVWMDVDDPRAFVQAENLMELGQL
jgi:1L-myo-inositol 1-phosphate cytidylyltransferase